MKLLISFIFFVFCITSCNTKKKLPIVGKWQFVKTQSAKIMSVEEVDKGNEGLTFTFTSNHKCTMVSKLGRFSGSYKMAAGNKIIVSGIGPQEVEFKILKLNESELVLDNNFYVMSYKKIS